MTPYSKLFKEEKIKIFEMVKRYQEMDEPFKRKFDDIMRKAKNMSPRRITKALVKLHKEDLGVFYKYNEYIDDATDTAEDIEWKREEEDNMSIRFSKAYHSYMEFLADEQDKLDTAHDNRYYLDLWQNDDTMARIIEAYPSVDICEKQLLKKSSSQQLFPPVPELISHNIKEYKERLQSQNNSNEEDYPDFFGALISTAW